MKIAIFGGSGFIGTRLIARLRAKHEILIIDIKESRIFPRLWKWGDVCDPRSFEGYLKNVDCIINLAAQHKDNVRPVSLYYDVNVGGARRICEAAARQRITKIVFTSSVAVYGVSKDRSEQNNDPRPNNHYGRSKWEAEKVYRRWHASDNGRYLLIIRPTVVFGENNRGNVYNLLRQIRSMPSLMIGMGANIKSLAYVENVAAFIESQLEHRSGSHIYNYVDKPDVSMRQLVSLVRQTIGGGKSPVIHLPYPMGAAIGRLYDFLSIVSGKEYSISAIRMKKLITDTRFPATLLQSLAFTPPFSLREGIEKTIRHEFLQQSSDRVIFESE